MVVTTSCRPAMGALKTAKNNGHYGDRAKRNDAQNPAPYTAQEPNRRSAQQDPKTQRHANNKCDPNKSGIFFVFPKILKRGLIGWRTPPGLI